MDQLTGVDDRPKRIKKELDLQLSLGNSLRATLGWSADKVGTTYTRALTLCEEVGTDEQKFPALWGLWALNFVRARFDVAESFAKVLLQISGQADHAIYTVLARQAQASNSFARGAIYHADRELARCLRGCKENDSATYLNLSGQEPSVHAKAYHAKVLWFLGYPERAMQTSEQAKRQAEPRRVYRRLQLLRGLEHEQIKSIFPRG